MILALDPGLRGSGAAIFDETTKTLIRAAYIKNADQDANDLEAQFEMARCVLFWAGADLDFRHGAGRALLVAEWPQIYARSKSKGDPNKSLLPLCGVVAHLSGAREWGGRFMYRPRDWKGTIDGDAMTARILTRITPSEKAVIEPAPKSVWHNAIDAVGIGLKYLGRLEREHVIHRW